MLHRRTLALLAVICVAFAVPRISLAAPATAPAPTALLFDLVNAERTSAGLSPLDWRDDVAVIANSWSANMAANGELAHNDAYFSDATRIAIGSAARGENVATAGTIEGAHQALMNSPPHRANILSGEFSQAGFGAVQDVGGRWWVTQNFLHPSGAGIAERISAPQPEPEPEVTVGEPEAEPQPRASQPASESEPLIVATPAPAPPPPPPTTAPAITPAAAAFSWPGMPEVVAPDRLVVDPPSGGLEPHPLPPLLVAVAGALILLGVSGHAGARLARQGRERPTLGAWRRPATGESLR